VPRWLIAFVLLLGCPSAGSGPFASGEPDDDDAADDDDATNPLDDLDDDEDGHPASTDCDDGDWFTWPGAPELCDEVDNDCDGTVDEDVVDRNWWADADADGWGADGDPVLDCARLDGHAPFAGDCDDDNDNIHPGALFDGIDADCDGRTEWRVQIQITVDDTFWLCVDDEDEILGWDSDWESAETYTLWLDEGPHVVGFRGWSTGGITTGALVDISLSNGQHWWSNENWRYDPAPEQDSTTRVGWCSPDFDASGWSGAWTYTPWGTPPWGFLPEEMEGTASSWIWDDQLLKKKSQYFRLLIDLPSE